MRRRRGGFSLLKSRRSYSSRVSTPSRADERVMSVRLRALGLALAVICAIAPALPLGPLFAQPPLPMAGLWVAFGYATERENKPRAWLDPLILALLGWLQDVFAGGPFGLHALLFVGAYVLAGMIRRGGMSGSEPLRVWAAFAATCVGVLLLAWAAAPTAVGRDLEFTAFGLTLAITAALFAVTMRLYRQDL